MARRRPLSSTGSSMSKRARNVGLAIGGLALGLAAGVVYYVREGIRPTPPGDPFYIRFDRKVEIEEAARQLKAKGVLRNVTAFRWYGVYRRYDHLVLPGTYQVRPGSTADEIALALRRPIRQMVRIPETNPSYRTARLLSQYQVTTAEAYEAAIQAPEQFQSSVDFPLPKGSLEGYLFPDTYDLPPLLGANEVVLRQLKAFEAKALPLLADPEKRQRILTIASMVELEAGVDSERAIIAGVIRNRLEKPMKLQIDATVLYGMRDWRRMTYADYKHQSKYNTYLIDGLPPGPICSPSVKSIRAALNPAKHEFLYYVAKPDRHHLFAKTYEEHVKNIAVARKLRAAAEGR